MEKTNDAPLTYQEACKIRNRLCEILGADCCRDCPLDIENNGKRTNCNTFMRVYTDLAEPILKAWAAEHPIKTNRDKFVEVFGSLTIEDGSCGSPCKLTTDTPCSGCDWWDKEYVKPEETDDE